jgi:ribonuclease P protein component
MKKGRKFSSPHLFVRVMWLEKEHRDDPIQCSFVVSAKVSKSAVKRHMLKRLGYTTIQKDLPKLKKGLVVAFFFTKGVESMQNNDLKKEIESLMKAIGIYEV